MSAAKPDSRIIQLAFNKGSKVEINLMPIMLKRLTLTGSTLRAAQQGVQVGDRCRFEENRCGHYSARGQFRTQTHATFSFEDVQEAHRMMESAAHRGKILLTP